MVRRVSNFWRLPAASDLQRNQDGPNPATPL
jgi:hypothetical protein